MAVKTEATIEDLYHVPEGGKAEIVNGELRLMLPTGDLPGSAGGEIYVSPHGYSRKTGVGRAYGDNVGFIVNLPNRRSFSPDVAYYIGPRTRGNSWTVLPSSLSRCAAKATMVRPLNARWPPSARTISLQAR